ncbi:conserved membrane hypothetical protein [Hyella patelloides LEGE 07179]|uniref:Cyclic nucleotide-binding protein n=1 Tax=Hyella patelloides LEGE 07179 TaxID=945734 RepID=A0A563W227_9CYAN|nr:hypothetical protein [Hyella patelloides]VEP17764.1 conserved membrane hypothetical protein [Hyella patelloides LEGE 07179]
MFSQISERYLHITRYILTIGWLVLIISLFYDPISANLTETNMMFGPSVANTCFEFQGECQPLTTYPIGARIFWGMVVPSSILILLIFGHEAWRRICPLSFFSQIPRALGLQKKRVIRENSWLHRNYLYLQFGLLFLGLNIRLLLVNSDRFLLGVFLLLTIGSAITVGFLYGGKTWCNYFCPMAPVQMIYSEPSSLLTSVAHTAPPKTITQSMCRTVDSSGKEKSACVACKSSCIDIDAEHSYWENINRPDRQLLYYAYIGLAIGFFTYFGFYSGNWQFLSSGVWNETNQLKTLLAPGFYLGGSTIPIPKLIAVPLTLVFFSGITYALGLWAEKHYRRYRKRIRKPLTPEQLHHHTFSVATFIAFNCLFFLGVRPSLGWLPGIMPNVISWIAIAASSLWLAKAWQRSAQKYARERDGHLLRRQLKKLPLNLSDYLKGRSLEELNPDELYTLATVMPNFANQYRLQMYSGVLCEALEQKNVSIASSFREFQGLRHKLKINDSEHHTILEKLLQEHSQSISQAQASFDDTTVLRSPNARSGDEPTTIYFRKSSK